MKKTIALIIGVLLFAGLIGGAVAVYNRYLEDNKPSNVVIVGGKDSESATEERVESVTGSGAESSSPSENESEAETDSPYLAPDLTVYDLEGNPVTLSSFRGKPIVLNFWSSGCGPCRNEMPHFQNAYEKYGDDVVFLMVDCIGFFGETVESGSKFVSDQGYTFPVYYDTAHNALGVYISNSLPYTFFIDRNFDLYTYIPGMADAEVLEECIGMILK